MRIRKSVTSSNLSEVEYDDKEKILRVGFKNGSWYEYYDVPREIFEQVVNGVFVDRNGKPSVGATFIKLVKNGSYSYKKLS